jgi:chitin disaccharide deacetylase
MLKSQQAKYPIHQITRPNTACLVEDEANALKSQYAKKNQNKLKMKFKLLFLATLIINSVNGQTLAERLGYDKNDKLLIIHNDDLGLAQSENAASYISMTKGIVNSGSVMMPCAWAYDAIQTFKSTKLDIGVHLTLTAEWKNYKWSPIVGSNVAPSLVNEYGHMYSSNEEVAKNVKIEEVEKELTAQIELAKKMGLDITHLDTHMGSILGRPDLINLYFSLGQKYKLPVLADARVPNYKYAIDYLESITPEYYPNKTKQYYENLLSNYKAWSHCFTTPRCL